MTHCFFVSDLHGSEERYDKLIAAIAEERPKALFMGGDLLPSGLMLRSPVEAGSPDFVSGFLRRRFEHLHRSMGHDYPRVFLILGNDDPRFEEAAIRDGAASGAWEYVHDRSVAFDEHVVFGYSNVPPTPFRLKDWERYDVSRYVDPGCVSPEDGGRTIPISQSEVRYSTIKDDLNRLTGDSDLSSSVLLFHSPPYQTNLDRAALDGKMIDHVPLDVNVGSIAIRRFIEKRQPQLTLHGHIHESARLTGSWRDRIGDTQMFSAAHDGPELALVRFDLEGLEQATRDLI